MRHAGLALLVCSLAFACSRPVSPDSPEEARAAARAIFESRCSTCHGLDGKGRGPLSPGLTPKPRDYTDRAWQSKVSDDEIRTAIAKGGMAVGKSALMPANPDISDRPLVVDDLRAIVRSFGTDAPLVSPSPAPAVDGARGD